MPETPVVTYAPLSGCLLPTRVYYGVVTFVDSLGGESTQSNIPFVIAVPAGCVLTVESPNLRSGASRETQAVYGFWNLYVGYSRGVWYRQNSALIPVGTSWVETTYGINPGALQFQALFICPQLEMQY